MRKELSDILSKVGAENGLSKFYQRLSDLNEFILQLTMANLSREELTIVVYELLNNHKGWILNTLLPACDKEDIDFDYREQAGNGDKLSMFEQLCYEYETLDEDVLNTFLRNISDESINDSNSRENKRIRYSWKPGSKILIAKRDKLLGR